MPTKAECLAKAAEYERQASAESANVATLVTVFGANDPVTEQARRGMEALCDMAEYWRGLARLDSRARARRLIKDAGI